ncbi:MAG TPA: metallophosphoesterase [Draconibacterium sp.]|nr:metallophosphoesterase [Draconibacterium sp.]
MFHLYLTLAYIIPNIYVFFRIIHLFIGKGYKLWYTIIYLILFAIYPLTGNYAEHSANAALKIISSFSGYLLPFYLYLFLSVVGYDLFLLLNLLLKMVSVKTRKSFIYRFYSLSALIFLSVTVVIGGVINLNTIRISKYKITLPKKSSDIDNLRVAFVSDIHIEQNLNLGFLEQFVCKVNAYQPDILLYGGDIVEGDSEDETSEAMESILKKIQTKYGTFGVVGNHEFYGGQEQGVFFRKANITLLNDTIVSIDNAFYLAGRVDQHFRNRKSIEEILQNNSADLPIILMDHRPTQLQEVSQTAVNVQFSGHTHNGQLFPINYIIHRMYELSWGYKKIRETHFFVSSGLRLWGPPVKTAGKSEIMVVDFTFR